MPARRSPGTARCAAAGSPSAVSRDVIRGAATATTRCRKAGNGTNALGTDQADVSLLQGEPGAPGLCDASACNGQSLPGASRVSTLLLRGVSGATQLQSFELNGIAVLD